MLSDLFDCHLSKITPEVYVAGLKLKSKTDISGFAFGPGKNVHSQKMNVEKVPH